jgi:hypothetical protein
VISIATGYGLSIAMEEDGRLGILGGKHFKLAEYARQLEDITYVAAGFFVAGAVKNDGTLIIWGKDVDRFSNPVIDKLVLFEGSE